MQLHIHEEILKLNHSFSSVTHKMQLDFAFGLLFASLRMGGADKQSL